LAELQATAMSYLRRDGPAIPFWAMASTPASALRERGTALAESTPSGRIRVTECASVPGGGSVPGIEIPSVGVELDGDHTGALRAWDTPIVARVRDGATLCDLRTVDPADDAVLAKALTALSL
jgi:L-seryl-tRNA(Ser) seleniumtransferase